MGLDLEAGEGLVGVESLLFLGVAVVCRGAAEAATIDDDGRGAAAAAAAELLLLLPASRRCDDDFDFDASVCLIAKGGKRADCRARARERERERNLYRNRRRVWRWSFLVALSLFSLRGDSSDAKADCRLISTSNQT